MVKTILLGHGSGGRLSHELIKDLFVKYFSNDILDEQTDAAVLKISSDKISFTSYYRMNYNPKVYSLFMQVLDIPLFIMK